jgi:hypothetical protein
VYSEKCVSVLVDIVSVCRDGTNVGTKFVTVGNVLVYIRMVLG